MYRQQQRQGQKKTRTDRFDGEPGLPVLGGMGGTTRARSERHAVKTISISCANRSGTGPTLADRASGLSRPSIILRDAIQRANKIIYQTARSQPNCEGMGTTVVAALFFDNRISIAHVGDSRLYRMRLGQIEQVTLDHSLLQELVDRGLLPEEAQRAYEQKSDPGAGVESKRRGRRQEQMNKKGDLYLMCSPGFRHGRGRRHGHHRATFEPTAYGSQVLTGHDNGGKAHLVVLAQYGINFCPARYILTES